MCQYTNMCMCLYVSTCLCVYVSMLCLTGARFYITNGAARQLTARRARVLCNTSSDVCISWALSHLGGLTYAGGVQPATHVTPPVDYVTMEEFLYSCSIELKIPVHELTSEVLSQTSVTSTNTLLKSCPEYLKNEVTCRILAACAGRRLR